MTMKRFLSLGCLMFLVLGAKAERPNILFCIADDASYPHMGAYGTDWIKSPGFDRVAKEGILFTRAYTPNAKCAPSRACVLTGRNSWELEEAANHFPIFPPKFVSYPEALLENGYFVGKTGKGWGPGVANDASGKRRDIAGKPWDRLKAKPPAKMISANDYAGNFDAFLDAKPSEQPFCFWYGATEPHRAYEFKAGATKGGKKPEEIDEVPAFWPDNETVRHDMLDYAFEIEHFDKHLLRMIESLEKRGMLENTLILVTSDNGMPFPRVKGQEYEMSNHLPCAAMWPKGIQNPGRVVDDFINFIDFAPTFLEIAGLDAKKAGMQSTTGRSLTDIFNSPKTGRVIPERDHVLIGKERHDIGRPNDWGYPIRGIVTEDYLYIENFEPNRWPAGNPETGYLNTDGSPTKTVILDMRRDGEDSRYWQLNFGKRAPVEFFDIKRDRYCMNNLASNQELYDVQKKLQERLYSRLKKQKDPRMFGNGHIFDEYIYSGDSTRGFYERFMSGEKIKAGWVSPTDFEKEPLD